MKALMTAKVEAMREVVCAKAEVREYMRTRRDKRDPVET